MEEETALAQAIERSFAQQVALPHVPGLTSDEAQVVRIRCQEEVSASLLFRLPSPSFDRFITNR